MTSSYVDPTANVSPDARVGEGTSIWNWTKVRESAEIGAGVSIGQNCYIDNGVVIGERCKIQNGVNIYSGEWTVTPTVIADGASIGANATIVCGVVIGEGALVGAGSVVIDDVPARTLVVGNPARFVRSLDGPNLLDPQHQA